MIIQLENKMKRRQADQHKEENNVNSHEENVLGMLQADPYIPEGCKKTWLQSKIRPKYCTPI